MFEKKEIALKIHNAILCAVTHYENIDPKTVLIIQNQLAKEFELVDKKTLRKMQEYEK